MPHPPHTLTLPLPNAHFIWYCAWLAIPSTIYAYSNPASTHLAIIPASVWVTSLLYWRDPVRDSWRRKLDMTTVFTGVSYQSYYAFITIRHTSPSHFAGYMALVTASVACYGISVYLMNLGYIWPSTYVHASIHLLASVANVVVYTANRYKPM